MAVIGTEAQTLTVRSTYELLCNSARAFASKPALTFLRTADPEDAPIRWSYAELLSYVHQTANLLNSLGVGPNDAVAVLLPGCLEYHLALWGGEAAGIVQPLNPLLSDEKLVSLMTVARAKVLIAYGSDAEAGTGSTSLGGGRWVATAALDHTVRLTNAGSRECVGASREHRMELNRVAACAWDHGALLATGTARVRTGEEAAEKIMSYLESDS